MLDIDGDALVPIIGRHLVPGMALIVGGIVDEDGDGAEGFRCRSDRILQRLDVGDVALAEPHIALEPRRELLARILGDIDKGDLRALLGKFLDDRFADPHGAA